MAAQPEPMTQQLTPAPAEGGADDYDRVRRAIAFVSQSWQEQPPLEEVAAHVGLSPAHFQRLFKRWAGISPKAFLQAITLDHARALLRDSASVLETAYAVGLSGPGRLHDLFVDHEAMTPGEYKARGEGIEMAYGFHASPFGRVLIMATGRGVAGLAFADGAQEERAALDDMAARWPRARYREDALRTAPYARRIFDYAHLAQRDGALHFRRGPGATHQRVVGRTRGHQSGFESAGQIADRHFKPTP